MSPCPSEHLLPTSSEAQHDGPTNKALKKSPVHQPNPNTLPATPTLTTTPMDSEDDVISVASSEEMMEDQDSDLSMGGDGQSEFYP